MNKREIEILGRAYEAEIGAAVGNKLHIIQGKSKAIQKLADDGYLKAVTITLVGRPPVEVEGYELTELGRLAYCTSD